MPHITDEKNSCFMPLGNPRRVWAIGAIHADVSRLRKLHDSLLDHVEPGDRIIYMGNYTGFGHAPCETIDELLTFRRMALSIPGMMVNDFVYLRGGQEVIWQKLSQLHYAPDPLGVLVWMLGNGLSSTLQGYGFSPHDGIAAAKEGSVALARWITKINNAVRRHPGHEIFFMNLRRAAFTAEHCAAPLLFVHAGIDPGKSLAEQQDNFFWGEIDFNGIHHAYMPFQRVVRGYDPKHKGVYVNGVTATIDGGCGFGGSLVAACIQNAENQVSGFIEV